MPELPLNLFQSASLVCILEEEVHIDLSDEIERPRIPDRLSETTPHTSDSLDLRVGYYNLLNV